MTSLLENLLAVDVAGASQRQRLAVIARERRWGLALMLIGWLHLAVFLACHALTIIYEYHDAAGYLLLWLTELSGMWLIFRVCGGRRRADQEALPLERLVRRVWITYFVLAFNLGSLNTLRGNHLFEFFPAIASLASFALIVMSIVVDWRFFLAVLVMFASGLLMAALLMHEYLIFAVAWWAVLNGIGLALLPRRQSQPRLAGARDAGLESQRVLDPSMPPGLVR